MKRAFAFAALALLIGCGDAPETSLAILGKAATSQLRAKPAVRSTPENVRSAIRAAGDKVPSPVLMAQIVNRQTAAPLLPIAVNSDVSTWSTPDGVTLNFRKGLLSGSRGLGFDLMSADTAPSRRALANRGGRVVRTHRYLDGEDQIFARSFMCQIVVVGTKATEMCRADGLEFENTYQLTSDGRIKSSRQWISPQLGYIQIEQIK